MNTSRSLYRLLLHLCPADLRSQFGGEMEALFLQSLQRARGLGKARVWAGAVTDVIRHGIGARQDSWQKYRKTSAYVESESGGWWMDTLRYDLRHGVRAMFRQKATTAIILLTLALAIGANTAVFSAVHAVLLKPLPYADPERLVQIYEKRAAEGMFTNHVSPADYQDWARLSQSFSAIAAVSEVTNDLTGAGEPERLWTNAVSAGFFDVFGVRAMHGRTFVTGEDTAGRQRVAVLTHGLWQQRFGGNPAVVGTTIVLNDVPHEVIGILPPAARFPVGEAQLFTPYVVQPGSEAPPRASHFLVVFARLKPGIGMEQARAEMDRIGRDLETAYPDLSRGHGAHVTPLAPEMVKAVRGMLIVLMAAVAFILLIACINVTNLLLARAAGRQREISVRAAIGAGRGRLVRQMLVETSLLALAGGAAGLVIAVWGVQLLSAQMPPAIRPDGAVIFSVPVLLFTTAVCVTAGLLAGVLPAWHLVRDDGGNSLKEGGRSPVSLRRRLRFGLIIAEVACTSLLLVGAGLTLRSFRQVMVEPAGIETTGRLTFNLRLPRLRYDTPEAIRRVYGELDRRLSAEPSVRAVGATSALPLTAADSRNGIAIEGVERTEEDGPTRAHPRSVTRGYLAAAGIRVVQGRTFADTDRTGPRVVIINEAMARRYWRSTPALGDRVRFSQEQDWREIVGIVADVKHWGLDQPVNPEMYLPFDQYSQSGMSFVIEAGADPLSLVPIVQRHVRELDANLPVWAMRTFDEVASRSVEQRRFTMLLLASFAVLALLLAAAGIYGVMAHLVTLRTPEIGVRLTLGAKPASMMRQILGEGAMQAGIGLMIGLGGSLVVMRGLRTILFGIEPTDPLTLVTVGASMLLVSLLAVAVPALRAMRVDPVVALRTQ